MTSYMEKTAETIRTLRSQHAMTQDELGERVHVSRQAVSRWETGETMPGVDTLQALSQVFGVTMNRLLGEPAKLICQCCGMELDESSISSEPDGSANPDYCKWCYADGSIVPGSLEELTEYLVTHVPLGEYTHEQAKEYFTKFLKELDYWKNKED